MHVAHYNHIKYIRGDDVRANDYPECAISTATYSHGHSYQESLQGKYKKGVGLAHSSCECAPDKVFENFPLLVVLDSLGGISCSRLVMSPSPISCSAKVAASHISGVHVLEDICFSFLQAPRILALSSCGMFLALGSSSMVQLFSIKVKDSPNSRFSVNLVLLSRFNFPFSLDHLFFTHPRSSSKPRNDLSSYELLAIDVAGNVGYCPVTICPYGFRIHPLGCNLSKKIATPPKMVRSALNMNRIDVVQSIRANGNLAVCLLDEKSGSLSLVHATNGQSVSISFFVLYLS